MTAAEKGYAGRPMTAESTTPPATAAAPREKTAIPKNPGRRDLGLKATLLFPDREIVEKFYVPIIYTACRTCYSEQEPEIIFERALAGDFDPLKMQKLISGVIESGHGSTIEHVVFTFAISGVSRTLSHQLVRHRLLPPAGVLTRYDRLVRGTESPSTSRASGT